MPAEKFTDRQIELVGDHEVVPQIVRAKRPGVAQIRSHDLFSQRGRIINALAIRVVGKELQLLARAVAVASNAL